MRFVASDADILLAVGGAGGSKTMALLMAAARRVTTTGYRAWLLRQRDVDLHRTDGLIDQARALYEPIGGVWYATDLTFRFETPDGESSIQLGHIGDDYKSRYQGPAAAFLGIDEATQVPRAAFWWFFSRLRSPVAPIRVRLTLNPEADSWVYEDLASWWVGEDDLPLLERQDRRRYLAGRDGIRYWGDTPEEAARAAGRPVAQVLSVAYMQASLSDNPTLSDEKYRGGLGLLEREDAASLAEGRWVRRKKGKLLKEEDLARELDAAPEGTRWVRAWDLGATPEATARAGTSYSAGILLGLAPDGRIIVGDAKIGRWSVSEVEQIVCATAGASDPSDRTKRAMHPDVLAADGRDVPIRLCREWAGAGKAVGDRYERLLVGWDVKADVESGKKEVRMRPFVAQAQRGRVYLVRGPWNARYRSHMLALTDDGKGRPNDAGDATARALETLTGDLAPTSQEVRSDLDAAAQVGEALSGAWGEADVVW
jgi:predicted phage terminase large subunit-like protein